MIEERQLELWHEQFMLNGFVILPSLVRVELIDRMHQELLPIALGKYEEASLEPERFGRGAGRLAFDVSVYGKFLRGALADDAYLANPVIHRLLDRIFGEGSWRTHWTNVEACFPGSKHMGWHSDQTLDETPDLEGPHQIVRATFNLPLVDFTWANGALEIIPGSHWLPRAFSHRAAISEYGQLFPQRLDLRRGDGLLRDGNGLHRGTPNLTQAPRLMLDHTYRRR